MRFYRIGAFTSGFYTCALLVTTSAEAVKQYGI
jgi:hypothetical protein